MNNHIPVTKDTIEDRTQYLIADVKGLIADRSRYIRENGLVYLVLSAIQMVHEGVIDDIDFYKSQFIGEQGRRESLSASLEALWSELEEEDEGPARAKLVSQIREMTEEESRLLSRADSIDRALSLCRAYEAGGLRAEEAEDRLKLLTANLDDNRRSRANLRAKLAKLEAA